MDFSNPHTEAMERFRTEVRTWIEANVPEKMKIPIDSRDYTPEMHAFWPAKHKALAKKGWLFPTFPKQYGGGGLTADHETVLQEEFQKARVPGHHADQETISALLVWGTEAQKQKFLVPLLTAEKTSHQKLTEPTSGADQASVHNRAVRDGDDWLLSGENVFISTYSDVNYLGGQAMTDPNAPRHRNTGFFIVANPSPGLQVREMELLVGSQQKYIYMDNVRIPGENLIGGDHQGWQVMGTVLEAEHGGRGRAFPRYETVENMIAYARQTKRNGGTVGSDPIVQQSVMDAYLESHVDMLFQKRTYWMYQNHQQMSYESNLASVHNRYSDLRTAIRVRDVMGPYSLLGTREPLAPYGGAQEVAQRSAAGQHHAGGSSNIAKVILARRIGISRTKERAAPTPSTATTQGS